MRNAAVLGVLVVVVSSCSDSAEVKAPVNNVADGPITIIVPELNVSALPADIEKGAALFASKGCKACHNLTDIKLVGPGLKGVTARRSIKWMERMILKPETMVKEDPVAKDLLAKHMVPMANQAVNPETELPALLAFLKSLE